MIDDYRKDGKKVKEVKRWTFLAPLVKFPSESLTHPQGSRYTGGKILSTSSQPCRRTRSQSTKSFKLIELAKHLFFQNKIKHKSSFDLLTAPCNAGLLTQWSLIQSRNLPQSSLWPPAPAVASHAPTSVITQHYKHPRQIGEIIKGRDVAEIHIPCIGQTWLPRQHLPLHPVRPVGSSNLSSCDWLPTISMWRAFFLYCYNGQDNKTFILCP